MDVIFTVILVVGLVQGIFIGLALLLHKIYASKENKFIGITLILLSLQGIRDGLAFWNLGEDNIAIRVALYYGLQGLIFIPYFLSVVRSLKLKFIVPIWVLLIPFILSFIEASLGTILTLTGTDDLLWEVFHLEAFWNLHWYLNMGMIILLQIYLFHIIRRVGPEYNKQGPFKVWIAFSVIISLWILFNLIGLFYQSELYYLMTFSIFWSVITAFVFWLTFTGIIKQGFIDQDDSLHFVRKKSVFFNVRKSLNQTYVVYYEKFIDLLKVQKIYLDANLTRDKVAQKLGISSGYLSSVISESSSQSFSETINEFRVKEVQEMLSEGRYNHFSLAAIGEEVGFKSRSAFYSNFKKFTGLTPSDYKKSKGL